MNLFHSKTSLFVLYESERRTRSSQGEIQRKQGLEKED